MCPDINMHEKMLGCLGAESDSYAAASRSCCRIAGCPDALRRKPPWLACEYIQPPNVWATVCPVQFSVAAERHDLVDNPLPRLAGGAMTDARVVVVVVVVGV
jgi:hypothetical protein